MPFHKTAFEGLWLFEPEVYEDERGFFYESYNQREFERNGISAVFVQDNQSFSKYGVVRGLHYQVPPRAQAKLVRTVQGSILDVILDLRRGSASLGRWASFMLSSENRKQLFIPRGFAHGFSVLSPTAEVFYKCDEFYSREHERGILFNDAALGIDWMIPGDKILVSDKDLRLPKFTEAEYHFE